MTKPEWDEEYGAYSYELEDEESATIFLEEIGGMPHPLGGNRVLLDELLTADEVTERILGRADP